MSRNGRSSGRGGRQSPCKAGWPAGLAGEGTLKPEPVSKSSHLLGKDGSSVPGSFGPDMGCTCTLSRNVTSEALGRACASMPARNSLPTTPCLHTGTTGDWSWYGYVRYLQYLVTVPAQGTIPRQQLRDPIPVSQSQERSSSDRASNHPRQAPARAMDLPLQLRPATSLHTTRRTGSRGRPNERSCNVRSTCGGYMT